jgi:hypothetical protein
VIGSPLAAGFECVCTALLLPQPSRLGCPASGTADF